MNKVLAKVLSQLNERQRQAVETIDGPMLVVAGPGTGKTQLLSGRVANILATTDASSNQILCLTFTNKAAVNMKSRIIELVGAEGSKVAASTFHSFAAEIMNLYPDYFWNAARLSVAPDSVQLDVIESIVAKLPLDNSLALKFAGQYTLLADIAQAIKLTKEAGLTPAKLRALIEANLAYIEEIEPQLVELAATRLSAKSLDGFRASIAELPIQPIDELIYPLTSLSNVLLASLDTAIEKDAGSGKCLNTSKWKSRWIQNAGGTKALLKERDRNRWWLHLADVYETYRQALHARGFYDYSDMLVEVISQLEQSPQILADIQERFSYVLIDEFQDTTPAQLRLAHLVADHYTSAGNPNLMVVGDDDQSIYKFNGAELNNMLGFKRHYPKAKIIVLTDNYRSNQTVLNLAEKVIGQAESRLVNADRSLNKNLKAVGPHKSGEVRALAFASRELQLSSIARDIKDHYRPGQHLAVLARGHDSLIQMAGLLQKLEVPVRYEQASNILDHEVIHQTYLVAKLLLAVQAGDKDQSNALVHKILRWPAWGLEPSKLWRLATANYPNGDWLKSLVDSQENSFRQLGEWFIGLAANADSQPLSVTIEQVLGLRTSPGFNSPVRDYFALKQAETNTYFHALSAIQLMRALVHEFSADKEPTLADLVRFIVINKDNNVIVADESPFITGDQAVQLMTVHKAKGLEFDQVYIIDAIDDNWRPRSGGRKPPANLPLQPPLDDTDDYIRLMYVAITRAKSAVTISAYYHDHAGRDVAPSSIIQAALPIEKIKQDNRQTLIKVLEENLHWPALDGGQESEMLKARLEQYSLSVTHLINFLDLTNGGPQYFKERNLLRLPEAKTASLSYGTAMHVALEAAQLLTNQKAFSLKAVKDSYAKALRAEQMPASDYSRYLTKGLQTLERLFDNFKLELIAGSLSEQNFKNVGLGQARLSGKLDRVDTLSGKVVISDYKTGRPLTSFAAKDKSQALKAYKHKLQLIFYALLARQNGEAGPIEGRMIYVDSDQPGKLILTYSPTKEDMDRLSRLINKVWPMIIALEFPDTSGYSKDLEGIQAFEADLLK